MAASAGVPVDVLFNAAGWQQLPTFLNKANLLQDFTATLLGLDPADDPTVDDAFLAVFLTSSKAGLVKIQVYETGTKTPISGVRIVGITGLLGEDLYADKNGLAIGLATSETSSCRVGTDYIDLTGQTTFNGATPAQKITNVTLYATRISNPSGKIETFTVSTQRMFTDKVKRVDVHAVGGGAGGSTGSTNSWSDGNASSHTGGVGGGAGSSKFRNNVGFTPNALFQVVVGNKGTGGVFSAWDGVDLSRKLGTNGGASSALGVSASGGTNTGGGSGAYIEYSGEATIQNATSGDASTIQLFGETAQPVAGGGDGGGGAAYMASGGRYAKAAAGADPNGGDGGETSGSYPQTANPGKAATGVGGGGGGAAVNSSSRKSANGGDGYRGQVWIRWWY